MVNKPGSSRTKHLEMVTKMYESWRISICTPHLFQRGQKSVRITETTQQTGDIESAFEKLASALQEGFTLLKPELLTFNDNSIDYCKFIKNFETNVESWVSDYQLRLSYMIQYCKGEAKSSIEDCVLLEPKEGYLKAREILFSRYGKSH